MHPDSLLALRSLDDSRRLGQPVIATALTVWPLMTSGRDKRLFLSGATMLSGLTQLRAIHDLADTTVLVSTLDTTALAVHEGELNAGVRESAFLRASWLASVELLLDLAAAQKGPRVRLWVRSSPQISRDFRGHQLVANDWLMVESAGSVTRDFEVHCFGQPAWPRVQDLFDDLSERDRMWNAKVAFDSAWPASDPRRTSFGRYCKRLARRVVDVSR